MITIDLGRIEYYDSITNQFIYDDGGVVRFEYSLKVIYDWEAKWLKPFLKGGLTEEEQLDFYMKMALDPIEEKFITGEVMRKLADYIQASNTATTFTAADEGQNDNKTNNKSKFQTAEELYAMMFEAQVPIEFETRNLNRLLVVLKIIGLHNTPPKKMSKEDIYKQNRALNEQRRKMYNSKG